LTIASQLRLLRMLQDGSRYPLGSQMRQSRAHVVGATNVKVPSLGIWPFAALPFEL
jgi:DNA-binding NtrC family response regulator